MPTRYSPQNVRRTLEPTAYDALNELFDRGQDAVVRRREAEERDRLRVLEEEDRTWLREQRGVQGARDEATLRDEGIYRGPRPRTVPARAPSVFAESGIGIGEQPGREATSPLAENFSQLLEQGRPKPPKLLAPAGAFVPGLGYISKHLTDQDLMDPRAPGAPSMALGVGSRPDPRYEELTPGFYRDTEGTPRAREERQMSDRTRRLAQLLEQMRSGGGMSGELMAEAADLGVPWSEIMPDEEDQVPTEEELRAAGVPERSIPGAMRDPTLARQLMMAYNRPPAAPRDPYGGRTRDQYMADLEESERRRRQVAEEFPGREGDPRLAERRRSLVETLGDPLSVDEQNALDQLARGWTREDALLKLEEQLIEEGVGEDEANERVLQLETYLDELKLRR
jgi:hypothetical protein